MALAALLIGVLIVAQGVVGLVAPELFVRVVRTFQAPPVIYFAAVIRVLIGGVLVLAAPASRMPRALRGLGFLIVIGGLLTPIVGVQFSHVVLGWWSEGGAVVVRGWACFALVLGAFVVYATVPNRRAA